MRPNFHLKVDLRVCHMPKYDLRYFHKCEGYPQSPQANYMNWDARMAMGMDTGVPWVM